MSQSTTPDDTSTDDDHLLSAVADQATFVDFFDRIHALVDEAILQIDTDGVDVQAVDPANVAMVDARLAAEACDSYDAAASYRTGVGLERVQNAIGIADDADETIELRIERDTRRFTVHGSDFDFEFAGIDPDACRNVPEIPDLDLPAVFDIEAAKLQRAIEAADMVSDHIIVEYTDGDVLTVVGSGDIDDVAFEWDGDGLAAVEATPDGPVESIYSLNYLGDLVPALDGDGTATVQFGDDFPMWMDQPIGEHCDCRYMLAPRIRSD